MEKDFQHFVECLKEAGARIEEHYFKLREAGSEEQIYRERVYCYEIYHQLRNALGNNFRYELDGELDKRGHEIIQGDQKPDFVVHEPGTMDRNLVVIEVKPVTVTVQKLEKDLCKLKGFLDRAEYYRAIILIYGDGDQAAKLQQVKSLAQEYDQRIIVIWHKGHGETPIEVSLDRKTNHSGEG